MPDAPDAPKKLSRDDMVARWVALGYSKEGAEGIADNMMRESGGDPKNVGDGGTSYGLFQHHAERKAALEKFAKDRGKPVSDPDTQIAFADQELRTQYPRLRERLIATKDASEAEDQFKRVFERPASIMWRGPVTLGTDRYRFADGAMKEHEGRKDTSIVFMPPGDYLDLSPPLDDAGMGRKGKSLRASLARGEEVQSIPTLDVDVDGPTATVTDQDGRHRAALARDAGVDAIPVAIRQKGEGAPTEFAGMAGKVLPADFTPAASVKSEPKPGGGVLGTIADAIVPRAQAAEGDGDWWKAAPPADEGEWWKEAPPAEHDGMLLSAAKGAAETFGDMVLGGQQLIGKGLQAVGATRPGDWLVADAQKGVANLAQATAPDRAAHPIASMAGDVVGTLPLAAIAPIGGEGLAATLGNTAIQGAAVGGLQPVTGQDGYWGEKAGQVTLGALGGAAGGALAEGVGRAAAPALNPLIRYVKGIAGPKALESAAAKEVLRRIAQDAGAGGPTAQDMLDLANAAPNKPLTLADIGGKNVLGLAGRMARAPGESGEIMSKALEGRDLDAGPRLVKDIDTGIARGSAYDAFDALKDARSADASPKYETALSVAPTMAQVRPIQRFITDPIGQEALQKGMRIMEIEALKTGKRFLPEDYGMVRGESGRFILDQDAAEKPNMRLLDAVKAGYDDIVESYRDKGTGRLTLDRYGRAVNDARAAYTGYLRDTFPLYREALESWSGPSQSMDALKAGQAFMRQRPEEIAKRMASLSRNDREFYKLGAADALRMAIGDKGINADEAKAIIRGNTSRERLRPLFDSEKAYTRFIRSVEAEGRMFGTRFEVLKGSQTAARQAEDRSPESEAFAHAARGAIHAAHGNWIGTAGNALKALATMNRAPDPALNAEIARILVAPVREPGSIGRDLLRNFGAYMPATRNHVLLGMRQASPLFAPALGAGAAQLTQNR